MKKNNQEFTTDVCLECSKKCAGCCAVDSSVPLTIKDIRRIERIGYKKKFFLAVKKYSKKEIVGPEKWWLDSFIDIGGVKYKLRLKINGKRCIFLKDGKGCILGDKRPFFCKIYPFWGEGNNVIIEKGDGVYCGVNKKGLTLQDKIKIMKENSKKIKKYFLEIKDDCTKNKYKHEKIISSLKKD
jgi:Fe-S-cluster containining protein